MQIRKVTAMNNGVSWQVQTNKGLAVVWDRVKTLGVSTPASSRKEYAPHLGRDIVIFRRRVCDVPLGTSPEEAVLHCCRYGELIDTL